MENLTNTTTTTANDNPTVGEVNNNNETAKTYTDAELQSIIQRESDKRVSQAMKTAQAKFEKKLSEQLTEAEKLRSMDADARKEYEYNQKVIELETREREFNLLQNKLTASQILSEHNLPTAFVDYIVAEDAETMNENIKNFEYHFNSAVQDAVNKRLSSSSVSKAGTGVSQSGLTKEQFNKLSLSQQAEIYNSNPLLYKQMTSV